MGNNGLLMVMLFGVFIQLTGIALSTKYNVGDWMNIIGMLIVIGSAAVYWSVRLQ